MTGLVIFLHGLRGRPEYMGCSARDYVRLRPSAMTLKSQRRHTARRFGLPHLSKQVRSS